MLEFMHFKKKSKHAPIYPLAFLTKDQLISLLCGYILLLLLFKQYNNVLYIFEPSSYTPKETYLLQSDIPGESLKFLTHPRITPSKPRPTF
jgi:hypothetical protein